MHLPVQAQRSGVEGFTQSHEQQLSGWGWRRRANRRNRESRSERVGHRIILEIESSLEGAANFATRTAATTVPPYCIVLYCTPGRKAKKEGSIRWMDMPTGIHHFVRKSLVVRGIVLACLAVPWCALLCHKDTKNCTSTPRTRRIKTNPKNKCDDWRVIERETDCGCTHSPPSKSQAAILFAEVCWGWQGGMTRHRAWDGMTWQKKDGETAGLDSVARVGFALKVAEFPSTVCTVLYCAVLYCTVRYGNPRLCNGVDCRCAEGTPSPLYFARQQHWRASTLPWSVDKPTMHGKLERNYCPDDSSADHSFADTQPWGQAFNVNRTNLGRNKRRNSSPESQTPLPTIALIPPASLHESGAG